MEVMMMRTKSSLAVLLVLVVLAVTFMLVFVFPVHKVEATAGERRGAEDYVSYVVRSGDTLWDIADENLNDRYATHADYISEVMRVNGLHSDYIYEGELIVIPVR